MIGFIKNIRENYRKSMNSSSEKCHHCNHYSYSFLGGGLAKIEHCRKQHKDGSEDCPDWDELCFSDWPGYTFFHGRVEK